MPHPHATVVRHLRGSLIGDACRAAKVTLIYARDDPYAVVADIGLDHPYMRWVFARELLAAGLRARPGGPAGAHHVFVWREWSLFHRTFFLEIRRQGTYTFKLSHREVIAFLRDSYQVVPDGAENLYVDIDGELNGLVA